MFEFGGKCLFGRNDCRANRASNDLMVRVQESPGVPDSKALTTKSYYKLVEQNGNIKGFNKMV